MNISRTLRLLSLLTAMTVFSAAGNGRGCCSGSCGEKAPGRRMDRRATQKSVSTAEMLDGKKTIR